MFGRASLAGAATHNPVHLHLAQLPLAIAHWFLAMALPTRLCSVAYHLPHSAVPGIAMGSRPRFLSQHLLLYIEFNSILSYVGCSCRVCWNTVAGWSTLFEFILVVTSTAVRCREARRFAIWKTDLASWSCGIDSRVAIVEARARSRR